MTKIIKSIRILSKYIKEQLYEESFTQTHIISLEAEARTVYLDGLDGVLEGLGGDEFTLLTDSLTRCLILCQATADGTGFLLTKIRGQELFAGIFGLCGGTV